MSIQAYIPSRDRACQADLLIRSLEKNAGGIFSPYVNYTYSTESFGHGYDKLKDKHPEVEFALENDGGEKDFYNFLEKNSGKLVALFADDCIFYRKTTVYEPQLKYLFVRDDLWTFTYRLGRNISIRDYVNNTPTAEPELMLGCDTIMWNWNINDFWNVWHFPVGFDGYIYRADDLLKLSTRQGFGRICYWEGMICRKFNENPPTYRPRMAAPTHSEVTVSQINTTHHYDHNTTKKFNMSLQELNDRFRGDEIIDLDSIDFSEVNCTHGEYPFGMIKNERT